MSVTWLDKLVVDLLTDLTLRGSDKKGEEVQRWPLTLSQLEFGMFVVPQFHTWMLATNEMAQQPVTSAYQKNNNKQTTFSAVAWRELPQHQIAWRH